MRVSERGRRKILLDKKNYKGMILINFSYIWIGYSICRCEKEVQIKGGFFYRGLYRVIFI
jgi:hypothetical protein